MCLKSSSAKLVNVMGYTAPRLHDGREWYIDFYIIDPATGEPRRKILVTDRFAAYPERYRL